jgi:hypothetical protein
MEELREELSEQRTVVSGLRGELRKFTDLKAKLQQQVGTRGKGGLQLNLYSVCILKLLSSSKFRPRKTKKKPQGISFPPSHPPAHSYIR